MSKMSQLNAMLTEQAYELGYKSLEEALSNGWVVNYETQILTRKEYEKDEQEEAHKAWLKEKSRVLTNLAQLKIYLSNKVEHFEFCGKDDWEILEDAIDFIEKGEI